MAVARRAAAMPSCCRPSCGCWAAPEDLIARFQRGGLGDVIASWISTGQNLPVSADQLREVLGADTVSALSGHGSAPQGDVLGQLAQMLPQVIDHLTPHGKVPEGGLGTVTDLLGALGRR
jgi:uncharacterized protein YidB (DUF937 family)